MCGLIKKEEGTRSYDFSSLVLHFVNCDKNLANILPDSSLKKKKGGIRSLFDFFEIRNGSENIPIFFNPIPK